MKDFDLDEEILPPIENNLDLKALKEKIVSLENQIAQLIHENQRYKEVELKLNETIEMIKEENEEIMNEMEKNEKSEESRRKTKTYKRFKRLFITI